MPVFFKGKRVSAKQKYFHDIVSSTVAKHISCGAAVIRKFVRNDFRCNPNPYQHNSQVAVISMSRLACFNLQKQFQFSLWIAQYLTKKCALQLFGNMHAQTCIFDSMKKVQLKSTFVSSLLSCLTTWHLCVESYLSHKLDVILGSHTNHS